MNKLKYKDGKKPAELRQEWVLDSPKKRNNYKWLDDCPTGVDVDKWIETYYIPWATAMGLKLECR